LMLDEPLGSLDAALRSQLIIELHRIIKSIGLTAIYVTHDQSEAFAIADRIVVMRDGTIEQIDAPETLYTRPRTAFTARFMGLENIVPVTGYRGSSVLTAIGEFCVPGTPSEVLIHPTGIRLFPDITEERLTARVQERVFRGNTYRIVVITDKAAVPLVFDMPLKARFIPAIGVTVSLDIKPDMVLPLSPSPSRNAL
jgi:thiamine transport system ATP-binding protein